MALFGNVCNFILDITGQFRIAQAEFEDDDSLDRPQVQLKQFVRLCDRMLMLRQDTLPYQRRYTFNTAATQSDYDLPNTTNLEAVKYHTFWYNVTGTEYALTNRNYREYKEQRLSQLATGKPIYWTALPTEEAAASRTNKVRLSPTPDDAYAIEYVAKKTPPALTAFNDVLLWDDTYIDALHLAAADILNGNLGTGQSLEDKAVAAVNSVRAWSGRPLDERRGVTFGNVRINDNLYRGDVSERDPNLHRW